MNRHLSLLTALDKGSDRSRVLRWLTSLRGSPSPRTFAELINELEVLAAEQPEFAPVHPYLAKLYALEGHHAAAREAEQRIEGAIRGRIH
jgi:hypothetical protein